MTLIQVRRRAFVPSFDPAAWLYQRLSDTVALDPNPAIGQELARQATLAMPWLNYQTYTAPLTVVPADQPLVPVKLTRPEWGVTTPAWAVPLAQAFAAGVPIPQGFVFNSGTDHEGCFYQPDYVGPVGHRGRYFEIWGGQPNTGPDAAQFPWLAKWGGRYTSTARFPGYFHDWFTDTWPFPGYHTSTPGDPDSTYCDHNWGTTATSLPLRDLELSIDDVARGRVDHALGLAVLQANGHRWPAQRHDMTDAGNVLQEGMRLCFPSGYQVPGGLDSVCELIVRSGIVGIGCGYVIWDHAGALSFRAEPGIGFHSLVGFPWADLRVIAS